MVVRKVSYTEAQEWNTIPKNVGIQPGTIATSEKSSKIDVDTRIVTKMLMDKYGEKYNLTWLPKLRREHMPFANSACKPDGGIFVYKGRIVYSIEAKYQKAQANAIERWHKNHNLLRMINPHISYLTFAAGEAVTGAMPVALNFMHLDEPNTQHPFYNTIYYSVNGFSVIEMFEVSEQLLLTTLKGIDNDETAIYVGRWQNKINQALSTIHA